MRKQGGGPLDGTLAQHIHMHKRAAQTVDPDLPRPYLTNPGSHSQDAQSPLRFLIHECRGLDQDAGNSSGNRKNRSSGLGLHPTSSISQGRQCCGLCGRRKQHGLLSSRLKEVSQAEPSQACLLCFNLGPKGQALGCLSVPGGVCSAHPHTLAVYPRLTCSRDGCSQPPSRVTPFHRSGALLGKVSPTSCRAELSLQCFFPLSWSVLQSLESEPVNTLLAWYPLNSTSAHTVLFKLCLSLEHTPSPVLPLIIPP